MPLLHLTAESIWEGSEDPLASVFSKYFDWLGKLLNEISQGDRRKGRLYLVVRDMSRTSPPKVSLAVVERVRNDTYYRDEYVQLLGKSWEGIARREWPENVSESVLKATPDSEKDRVKLKIDDRLMPPIKSWTVEPEDDAMTCLSSYEGRLEVLSIHNSLGFRIYPVVGPKSIECSFKEELLERAKESFGAKIVVYGEASYRAGEKFPYKFKVSDFERLSQDDQLPLTMKKLHTPSKVNDGRLPEEYVRDLRDKWSE